ncbi:MAG: phosphatidate cytidylyltransferase [Sphingomonadaceae bacterium]|nr:phosphatidate cytidylyltransferase [Sphingomonadaceae bacterium]
MAKPSEFRNLLTRFVTGIILVGIAVGALYAGKSAFWLLAGLFAVAMIGEWANLMSVQRWKAILAIAVMAALLVFVQPLVRPIDQNSALALLGGAVAVSAIAMSLRLGIGFLYIGLAILAIIFLREEYGIALTLWTLAIVWATDIGAYFSGKTIGGPKLAPQLSPNKTWAGLIGGMATALLVSSLIILNTDLPRWLIPVTAALAVVAQAGDLYESWLKRRAGVKDASGIFPGHGGALDRLDGLMPVAIVVAAMATAGRI